MLLPPSSTTSSPMWKSSSVVDCNETLSRDHRGDNDADAAHLPLYSWSDVVIKAHIGSGAFCMVLKATHQSQTVALKCPKDGELDSHTLGDAINDLQEEVRILTSLYHPNIVSIMSIVRLPPPGSFCFMMECLQDYTLETLLREWRNKTKTKKSRRSWFFGWKIKNKQAITVPCLFDRLFGIGFYLIRALNYLHDKQIVHCDIKPENIGFDRNGVVKLFDFGLSQDMTNPYSNAARCRIGSYRYMAPEILSNYKSRQISFASDIYSYAILLWELTSLEKPHEDLRDIQSLTEFVVSDKRRPPLDLIRLVPLRELLSASWNPDPSKRLSSKEVVHDMAIILSDTTTSEQDALFDTAKPLRSKKRDTSGRKIRENCDIFMDRRGVRCFLRG